MNSSSTEPYQLLTTNCSLGTSRYIVSGRIPRKTLSSLVHIVLCLFTDPFPSNRRPIVAIVCSHGNMFMESLPIIGLLGKDLETNNQTTAVATQRRGKRTSKIIELMLETVFSTRYVRRQKNNWGDAVIWKSAFEEKTRRLVWNFSQPGSLSIQWSSVKKRVSYKSAAVKRRIYV
jgi:hypothetical protein